MYNMQSYAVTDIGH